MPLNKYEHYTFQAYLSTLPFHTHLPPPPILLFLPGNSRNLYGPNLVIWIITSIFYSKVLLLPGLEWNASPHTIEKYTNFKPFLTSTWQISAQVVDVRSWIYHRGRGRNGRRRVRWCTDEEKKYLCKFNNSWIEEYHFLSRSYVNNAHDFCKVCCTNFNIEHSGKKLHISAS